VDERFHDPKAESSMEQIIGLIEAIRRARSAAGAPPRGGRLRLDRSFEPELAAVAAELAGVELADELAGPAVTLAESAATVEFPASRRAAPADGAPGAAEVRKLRSELERAEGRLANQGFLQNAPADVVERERARAEELRVAIARLEAS
jgi:valyl-tRNA synthetase